MAPWEGAILRGKGPPIVKYNDTLQSCVQKRLNRSRCRLQGLKCAGSHRVADPAHFKCWVSTGSLGLWFTATARKYIYDFAAILQVNEGAISAQ